MKVVQVSGTTWSIGPWGALESRTATVPGRLRATSTHSPCASPLLYVDFLNA